VESQTERPTAHRSASGTCPTGDPWSTVSAFPVQGARAPVSFTGTDAAMEQRKFFRTVTPQQYDKWAHQDSNLGPRDYESPALTAEL